MGRGGGCLFAGDLEEVGGLDLTFWRLRWVRRVGVGVAAADGVLARGFAPGVTGDRGAGMEGVLFKRVLTSGLDDEDGCGRRDIAWQRPGGGGRQGGQGGGFPDTA